MNRANADLQMRLLRQTFVYRFQSPTIPVKPPPKFVATPRPNRAPNRAPKPARKLTRRERLFMALALIRMAAKAVLRRLAYLRPIISDTDWCALPFVATKGTRRTTKRKLNYGAYAAL